MHDRLFATCIAAAFLAIAAADAGAEPWTPPDDNALIETLPTAADPALRALAVQRRTLQHSTSTVRGDATVIQPLVRNLIAAARRSGDPRYLGQAQQLLEPWSDSSPTPAVPVDIRVLRATIAQSLHRFDDSLVDLNAALRDAPNHIQALLTRATVLQVRGRFTEAQEDCRRLAQAGASVPAQLCLASIAGLTGGDAAASRLLNALLTTLPDSDGALRAWTLTLLAEQAERRGELDAASAAYRRALQADPDDRYVRASWSDVLLEQKHADAVLALTRGREADDTLLLRQALALAQLRDANARASAAELRERFRVQRQRGDATHLREEALLSLLLEHDAASALRLAQQNWQQQREPADARVLYLAARACRDQPTLQSLHEWLRTSGLRDRSLVFSDAS